MISKIKSGKFTHPIRLLVFGQQGVGKSTFASQAPNPVFLGADSGTAHLDVARFPEPTSWKDVTECLKEYATVKHPYKTLVLDPIGWLEPIAYNEVCQANGWRDIEQPGYGKGYVSALMLWRKAIADIEAAWLKGSNVILLAHSVIKTFNNPIGDNYDRYVPLINEKLSSLLQGWCDGVFFACHDVKVTKESKGVRGDRVLHTTYAPGYDAKNRWNLPEQIPLNWHAFIDGTVEVESEIEILLKATPPQMEDKVRKAMIGANSYRMKEILTELRKTCT